MERQQYQLKRTPIGSNLTRYFDKIQKNSEENCGNFLKNQQSILLPKFFWPTVRKNSLLLEFEAESREFETFLKSLEQFIQTVKGQNIFW